MELDYSKPKIDKCTICGAKPFDDYNGRCEEHARGSDRYWSDENSDRRWFDQDKEKRDELTGRVDSENDNNRHYANYMRSKRSSR